MSTVGKALMLLEELSTFSDDAGLAEIAQKCALDRATAHRFLVELEKFGMVERGAAGRKYRLGPEIVRLARIREFRVPYAGRYDEKPRAGSATADQNDLTKGMPGCNSK